MLNLICRIGIFMICAQTILHFRPNVSYEKYLKLLVNAMLFAQILISVTGQFGGGIESGLWSGWFAERKDAEGAVEKRNGMPEADKILNEVGKVQQSVDEKMKKALENEEGDSAQSTKEADGLQGDSASNGESMGVEDIEIRVEISPVEEIHP